MITTQKILVIASQRTTPKTRSRVAIRFCFAGNVTLGNIAANQQPHGSIDGSVTSAATAFQNNDAHQPAGAVDIPCSSGPSPTRLLVIAMSLVTFENTEPKAPVDRLVICGFPMVGERVIVTRQSGVEFIARLALKPDATFRDCNNLHWLTDDDKFADVASDPIVSWSR